MQSFISIYITRIMILELHYLTC